jgi:hypothetical protein
MNEMYLTTITRIRAHTISDSTPSTLARVAATACSPTKHSFIA